MADCCVSQGLQRFSLFLNEVTNHDIINIIHLLTYHQG